MLVAAFNSAPSPVDELSWLDCENSESTGAIVVKAGVEEPALLVSVGQLSCSGKELLVQK